MIVIVCIDDDNGMMFNHRRQSVDKAVQNDIINMVKGSKLWMNQYSRGQFINCTSDHLFVDNDFINRCGENEYAFVEDIDPSTFEADIKQIIIYHWNRRYPSDIKFTLPLAEHGWKLASTYDFTGESHDKITKTMHMR